MNTAGMGQSPGSDFLQDLRHTLRDFMDIQEVTVLTNKPKPAVRFVGLLFDGDSEAGFDNVIQRMEPLGYTPHLNQADGLHTLEALPYVIRGKVGNPWVNAVMFLLTLLSVLFVGALQENVLPEQMAAIPALIFKGWRFTATVLGILTAHELSHYFMGRRYGSPTSLPYFIPFPVPILGTMGAVILQRAPMRSRKSLFDIGVAGPIGGLLVAAPLLLLGLAYSEVGTPREFIDVPAGESVSLMQEGNSLLYLGAKALIHGRVLPDKVTGEDVWLSPPSVGGSVGFAAWAGLLVTSLNLLPIGQLDGGHIAYAMWGRKAWTVARVALIAIFAWGVILLLNRNLVGLTWLLWSLFSLRMGPNHPPPLNDLTPLDARRRRLGWIMVAVFLAILVPVPLLMTTL